MGSESVNQPQRRQAPRATARPLPKGAYASWPSRVLASIIDLVPYLVVVAIGLGVEMGTRHTLCAADTTPYDITPYCATGNSTSGLTAFLAALVIGLLYLVWNYGYRQGRTGASIGKTVMKFRVVDETTRQPIGFGKSIVRQLAHLLDTAICYVGFLFPLWDAKRQTLADKLLKTVCLPTV
jgi:uncharacterized RDD family membrane protein YckC